METDLGDGGEMGDLVRMTVEWFGRVDSFLFIPCNC